MIRLRPDAALAADIERLDAVLAAAVATEPGRARVADEPGWAALADAGLLQVAEDGSLPNADRTMLRRAIASELAGSRLAALPLLDTLFAVDVLGQVAERPAGLLADVAAGRQVPALALDRRLGVRAGADTGAADLSLDVRGACLDGELRLVSAAGHADVIVAVVPSAGDVAVVTVGVDDPGVAMVRQADLGHGDLWRLSLRRVRVTPERLHALAVPAGRRWAAAVDRARIGLAAHLVGVADGAVRAAITHVRARVQFGRPLAAFQAVSFPLADALARIRAAQLLVRHAAWAADAGHELGQLAAQALGQAGDLAVLATTRSLQAHGAAGLTTASVAQRFYRRAAAGSVWLGSGTALAEAAATWLVKGGAPRLGREDPPCGC